MARFEARRKSRRSWLSLVPYRAELRDLTTGASADIATHALAEQIVDLLNRAETGTLPPRVESDALLPRYEDFRDPQDLDRRLVARFDGAYPGRQLARTYDLELARSIAALLNRVDPGTRRRVRHGIGWW